MEQMTLNSKTFDVIRLLDKDKGGYSYLVTDSCHQYVLKQIRHEPCSYYQFGDKLGSELRDYERLRAMCEMLYAAAMLALYLAKTKKYKTAALA